jgi:hypothetical protein
MTLSLITQPLPLQLNPNGVVREGVRYRLMGCCTYINTVQLSPKYERRDAKFEPARCGEKSKRRFPAIRTSEGSPRCSDWHRVSTRSKISTQNP